MIRFVRTRWLLGAALAVFLVAIPVIYYRARYAHSKRLRVVTPGVLYRSGCLTANGFKEAIRRYQIRTVINLQDEFPDPELARRYLSGEVIHERDLCERLKVRYVWMPPDLISRRKVPAERPEAIERFLAILDDPANYPILIHCKAGLHRTGVMAAVYRMEYQGWSAARALRELKDHGFGDSAATAANDYILQYILCYRPGQRSAVSSQRSASSESPGAER
ncbi:MAG: tyrosine-protein phosphatase [Gemmataceae bacterium]|nr:tyrosine-protein phosphatase [Gemmataceae bacterium]